MLVSVIVPYLNEELTIESCLQSLLDQDYDRQQYELIFIDNGSTDRSAEIVRRYPQVIALQEREPNVYAARNQGLSVARGQIIAFTDADCTVSRNWLSALTTGIFTGQADIVLGYRSFAQGSSALLKVLADYENYKIEYTCRFLSSIYFYGYTNNMAVKSELFTRVGPFRKILVAGDTDFIHRCVAASEGLKVDVLPEMHVCHWEIQTLIDWLQKQILYGRYNYGLEKQSRYRPLPIKNKLEMLTSYRSSRFLSLVERIQLMGILAVGQVCYCGGQTKVI